MEAQDDLIAARRQKLEALRAHGIDPYGGLFPKTQLIQALVAGYREGEAVVTAGRLSARRGHGALTFADLRDSSGKIQLCFRQERLGEAYKLFDMADLGDWLGVEGALFKTKTGEVTIEVRRFVFLSKSLRPLPEKWHGLRDVEIRYRRRYLDLVANEPVRRVFEQRAKLMESLRRTLKLQGYLEVETPMMHAIPGGAAGDPFITHHQALDMELYMRLAPELHLKRLLVGGFERVYEINRSFRNEGLSTRHNPEFTMLEAYQAYGDCSTMMTLVEQLIKQAAQDVLGTLTFEYQGQALDLSKPWPRLSFADALEKLGLPPNSSQEQMQQVLAKQGITFKELNRSQLVRLAEQLFDLPAAQRSGQAGPKAQATPVFVVDYWTELSPLAKSKPDNPLVADRFELFAGGMEVANAYSELNDPIEQRRRLEAQLQTSDIRLQTSEKTKTSREPRTTNHEPRTKQIDEDFLEALEYGMPPAGGLGVGVDRLAMLLLNQPSIKDVILFPLLKPEASDE